MEFDQWRRLLVEADPVATDSPPAAEEIWDAAAGLASRDRTDELLERSLRDPADSAAWQLAIDLQELAAADDLAEDEELLDLAAGGVATPAGTAALRRPAGARHQSTSRRTAWALGIAAILACAVGWILLQPQAAIDPGAGDAVYRSAEEVVLRPVAVPTLSTEAATLRWTAEKPVESYRVFVTTEDLTPVAEARDLVEAEWTIPAASLEGLAPGTRLLWRVEGRLVTGDVVSSETLVVELAPGG